VLVVLAGAAGVVFLFVSKQWHSENKPTSAVPTTPIQAQWKPRPSLPLFPEVQSAVEHDQDQGYGSLRQRYDDMIFETKTSWSEATEVMIRKVVTDRVNASDIEVLVSCREIQCLVQMRERRPLKESEKSLLTSAFNNVMLDRRVVASLIHVRSTVGDTFVISSFDRQPLR
jgi:hypothetical protein